MSNLKQQAESGLSRIEDAIIEFVKQHPEGVSNKQIAVELGLESDIEGKHTNYLSWSILGNLQNRKLISKQGKGRFARYIVLN
ncbi:TPA: hypothetical protein NBJ78_004652 [Klebsiella pneumoniae]|nr:hypothetical protein [Klebsiella pneumoniae]